VNNEPRVVITGGGFGGLCAARGFLVAVERSAVLPSTNSSLSDALNPPVFVMLREVAITL
jgi:NADH dehydrogenase FAD-containing subunit